jgi:hypothetical protein
MAVLGGWSDLLLRLAAPALSLLLAVRDTFLPRARG